MLPCAGDGDRRIFLFTVEASKQDLAEAGDGKVKGAEREVAELAVLLRLAASKGRDELLSAGAPTRAQGDATRRGDMELAGRGGGRIGGQGGACPGVPVAEA